MHHILLIEDDSTLRRAVADVLSAEYFVTTAAEGQTGLQLAVEKLPDIIISDVRLPNLSGFDLLVALRRNERTADIPVILLTAMADHESVRQGMALGADDYVTKPFDLDDLLVAIQTQLEKSSQRRQRLEARINELRDNVSLSLPHELRTAIMVIEGYTHLALEDHAGLDEEHQHMLAQIWDNAGRLHSLAEKFLWHIRVQWPIPAKMRQDFVTNCDREIHQTASRIAASHHRARDLQLDLKDGDIQMPEEYFQRLLTEVIDNAFKFSPQDSPVLLQADTYSDNYYISVMDRGRGLSAEQIASIDAFVQFERSTCEQQGTGLGLTIARRLVNLAGGQFHIGSIPGSGTLISIAIPCRVQSARSNHVTDRLPAIAFPP